MCFLLNLFIYSAQLVAFFTLTPFDIRIKDVELFNLNYLSSMCCFFAAFIFFTLYFRRLRRHFIIAISFDGKISVDVCHLFYFNHFYHTLSVTVNMNQIHEFPAFDADLAHIWDYIYWTVWAWAYFQNVVFF